MQIGDIVGNYRIAKLIATGGMGSVYLAEHPGMGRKAAVKVLQPDLADNHEIVARFFNEARAANAVRHPGIVEIFDCGTLPTGVAYIVMEFLEGESVAARIQRKWQLPTEEAVDIAGQAAEALAAAHAAGIVHRDLKPDNLFLIADPRAPARELVKVLDFGIAKLGSATPPGGGTKTRTGSVMGTPYYMSPEQCRGVRDVDHRTDIYAMGVIVYEMLCGRPPFVSEGFGELAHLHISAAPQPLRSLNPDVPALVEHSVLRALEKAPDQRFQSVTDFARALRGQPPRRRVPRSVIAGGGSPAARAVPDGVLPGNEVAPARRARTTLGISAIAMATTVRSSQWLLPAGLLTISAAAVVAALLFHAAQRSDNPRPSAAAPMAVAARAKAASTPAQNTITVDIASEPSGARITRQGDGKLIGLTPYRAVWPSGARFEVVLLEKEGFRASAAVLWLGGDVRETLKLLPPVR